MKRAFKTAPTIRPARPEDVDALVTLENEVFDHDQLDRRAFRYALRSPTMLCVAAVSEEMLVGYALVQRRRDSGIARLTSIAVAKKAAGQGLGAALLAAIEAESAKAGCTRMRLEVRADNEGAKGLYRKSGYMPFATVPEYYDDGTAAERFERAL